MWLHPIIIPPTKDHKVCKVFCSWYPFHWGNFYADFRAERRVKDCSVLSKFSLCNKHWWGYSKHQSQVPLYAESFVSPYKVYEGGAFVYYREVLMFFLDRDSLDFVFPSPWPLSSAVEQKWFSFVCKFPVQLTSGPFMPAIKRIV